MYHNLKASYRSVFKRLSRRGEDIAEMCSVSVRSLYDYIDVFGRDPEAFSRIPAEVIEAFLILRCKCIYFYTLPPNPVLRNVPLTAWSRSGCG